MTAPVTVLRTARLVIRPKEAGDADAMHAVASEWEVVRWTATWPWPPDRAFTEARMAGPQPERGMFGTILRGGAVIGMASVFEGELGYMLHPGAWRQGFATEACAALVRFAFETTDWPEVTAGIFDGNEASVRVVRKLGFERSRSAPERCRALGREVPGTEHVLARAAWLAGAGRPGSA